MKKHLFSKYVAMLLGTCLIGFVLLLGFLSLYTTEYFSAREKKELEDASLHASFAISTMMELTQQDFAYLLEEKRDLLLGTLTAQTVSGEGDFFITDGQGKIVIARDGTVFSDRISTSEFARCRTAAKEAKSFQTDLGGILKQKKLCRVLLLEKEFSTEFSVEKREFLPSPILRQPSP